MDRRSSGVRAKNARATRSPLRKKFRDAAIKRAQAVLDERASAVISSIDIDVVIERDGKFLPLANTYDVAGNGASPGRSRLEDGWR